MKILWAVNAFDADKQPLRAMASLLRPLAGNDLPIQAVYVANHAEQELMLAFDIPAEERFSSYPLSKLQEAVKNTRLAEGEITEKLIYEPSTSATRTAERIFETAKETKAHVIATYTHGRKGLERFFLGSFAETLLYRSPLPVLLVRPGIRPVRNFRTVLFASDGKPASRRAYQKLLTFLPPETKIVVYHLGEPMTALGTAGQLEEKKQRKKLATEMERYVNAGQEKGFDVKVVTEFEFAAPAEAINDAAVKNRAHLIVVAAQKGTVEGVFLGSTTRKLVRESATPLLVFRN